MGDTKEETKDIKFQVVPEGAAGLFLLAHCRGAGKLAQQKLAELLKLYWLSGAKDAMERIENGEDAKKLKRLIQIQIDGGG